MRMAMVNWKGHLIADKHQIETGEEVRCWKEKREVIK
jgi:hypothetical protein